jgi:hypothetical protein
LKFLHWLWRKGVKEPASIKGWAWTLTFLVLVLAAFNLLFLLAQTKQPFVNHLAVLVVAWLVLRWLNNRKKSPGKPLPYRRKR